MPIQNNVEHMEFMSLYVEGQNSCYTCYMLLFCTNTRAHAFMTMYVTI